VAARGAPLRFARGFATRPGLCRSYTTTRGTTINATSIRMPRRPDHYTNAFLATSSAAFCAFVTFG